MDKLSQTPIQKSETGENTISAYRGTLTKKTVVRSVARVKAAFPALPPAFYKIFIERVRDKGFSDERLKDAVNHVIDTCPYPTPALANFLSFDRRVKILTHREVVANVTSNRATFDDYDKVTISEKVFYVLKTDKILYNL